MFKGNLERTGEYSAKGPKTQWFEIQNREWGQFFPAISDGVVYFGSYDNHLYAVDIETGQENGRSKQG